jgi:enamine deaminase RidA (YjgF/YER057c/UK114 family)
MENIGGNMPKELISSGSPFEKDIGFSRAVKIGNIIAVSGTAPIAPDGTAAFPGDLYAQTRHCLEIVEEAIANGGGDLDNVVRTRVYLTDISRWKEAAKAHGEFFGEIQPASTFIEVKGLVNPEWMVEIEADCYIE